MQSLTSLIVRRTAAIGDSIAASVVADKLVQEGFEVTWQTHPMIQPIMKLHPKLKEVTTPAGYATINLDGVYEKSTHRKTRHFHEFFIAGANYHLRQFGITLSEKNCRPRLEVPEQTLKVLERNFAQYERPWTFICPRSEYYNVRQVPEGIWFDVAPMIPGTKFWIGKHPAPAGFVNLGYANLQVLAGWLKLCDLLITTDTGPMHIANAVGTPVLAIGQSSSPELHLSDQTDFLTIQPSLDCLNCQENICPKNQWKPPCQEVPANLIAANANRKLLQKSQHEISAVIPIFRPSSKMLNRCLEAVLPQVNEVITTRERDGILPQGVIRHSKLKHVVKNRAQIGFGRNVNFGFRHTKGRYVLVLNDDVYLDPNAVARMMQCMREGVGIVGHLTRYPDGTIYHAGKVRQPGPGIGFPHIDLRKRENTIKQPMEMENTNGCSMLIRREAFYDAGCFDEEFQFYAEDDDLCMRIRLAGWKIMYTPYATAIHDEHQETRNIGGIDLIRHQSNARFGKRWAQYFLHNADNRGLGNFDYLKANGHE